VATVAGFAESATAELHRATGLVEALLNLARPVRRPVDLWVGVQPIVTLRNAISTRDEGAVLVERPVDADLSVSAGGDSIRLALATALELMPSGEAPVRCEIERSATEIVVTVHGSQPPAPVADRVRAALAADGVELECSRNGITLRFAPSGHEAGNAR
jgi:hypothetical protein